ncbi:MAG: response regulator [Chloroflexota bacterium]
MEDTKKYTVLIVDDHAPAAEMVSQIFSMRGYNAITVDNGEDAIQLAQSLIPDVILLDVMMPVMDGYQVLNELKASSITHKIPIILVTANDAIEDIEEGLGLGADDYIPKPVKPREMLARVQSKIQARELRQDVEKRTTELEAILRFSQELNMEHDLNSLLDLILLIVLDLIQCDLAAIYHIDDEGYVLDYREQQRTDNASKLIDPGLLYETIMRSEPMLTWNNTKMRGTDYTSGMTIRLNQHEQTHGVLVVVSHKQYDGHSRRLFETIGRQTALALRNAEIYEHLEEMVEKRTQELRSAEQLLVRAEKLASVGQLAAGIAHEINNPLMPIRMNLEMMQEDMAIGNPIVEEDITETLHSVNRISRIVERLQQFTRGRGTDVPEVEPMVVADVIENVLRLTDVQLRHNGVDVQTNLTGDDAIVGNRDQLEQVFLNIILNGQAAMPDGGTISIQTMSEDKYVVIQIGDTGYGIEADKIEKIFDPFFSTKETGSGLGLFVSHNIIHSHNGTIEVESKLGKGTVFTITLPKEIRVTA